MNTKVYGIITGIIILFVYFVSYFIKDGQTILPVLSILGFVLIANLIALFCFSFFFKRKNKFKKTTFTLSVLFLSLIGESVFVLVSFMFKIGLTAFFDFALSEVWIFPMAYSALFIFNRIAFRNEKFMRINAIIGTVFLFAGLFIPGKIGFLLLGLCGLLFSSVLFRVFYYYIPKELKLD